MSKYLNLFSIKNKQRYISESILDENIPRDLLKAYKKTTNHPSHRHPGSAHTELKSADEKKRRFVNYGYGSSDYREITPEEAIRLVRENKHNIENIRALVNGELVEYEVRDNGSIYAIYGNSIDEFVLTNPDGTTSTYKNIRFAPWRSVFNVADKLYYTDEYNHEIDTNARSEKNTLRSVYKPLLNGEEGYDEHKPYDSYTHTDYMIRNVPDTGSHTITSYDSADIPAGVKELLVLKKDNYTKYDLARRALKKLEQEKNDYDDAEYAEKYDRLSAKVADYLQKYNEAAKAYVALTGKYLKWVDEKTFAVRDSIAKFMKEVQDQLDLEYKLKREYQDASNVSVNYDLKNSRDAKDIITRLADIGKYLNSLQSQVGDLNIAINDIQTDNDSEAADNLEKLASIQDELDNLKSDYANKHIEYLSKLASDIDAAKARYNELKPLTYQKKLDDKAKNDTRTTPAQLDPKLTNIVQFVKFADNKG